jgi:hypothetical protein
MNLPLKVWTYWTGPTDDIYRKCMMSWKTMLNQQGSEWEFEVVSEKTLPRHNLNLPSNFSCIPPQMQSDIIRLGLLYKYGGVWMDATILLNRDLSWLSEFVKGCPTDSYFACQAYDAEFMENWLIAVPSQKNPHILKLRDALMETLEIWPYVQSSLYYKGVKKYTRNDSYFMMYQCYCWLKDHDNSFRGATILPIYVQLAFIPVEIPFFDARHLIKYTSNCRHRANGCTIIFWVLFYLVVNIYII